MNKKELDRSLAYIDSWLTFRYEHAEVPGYVVAVAHKGEVVFNKAYGYADVASQTKLTPQHVFRIASQSKTFTATALMQLQEQGKLKIDEYAVQYLPWLKEHTDTRWQTVTIRQLMSHGAGVIRDGLASDYWQLGRTFPDEAELRKEILEADLVIEPNTKHKYSNFGYSLLGLLVASASGVPYEKYVAAHIIQPLRLKHTGVDYSPEIEDRLATGYTRRDVNNTRLPILRALDTHAMSSATGFYTNAEDLCAYYSAQLVGTKNLLSDESKKEMQRTQWHAFIPAPNVHVDYGLGLDIDFIGKHRVFGHGGGFPGHISKSFVDPENDLVIVVMTNCIDGPAGKMARGIYQVIDYFQQHTPSVTPKHDLTKFEGRYVCLWAVSDIVATGDRIVATSPDTWEPLTHPEILEFVDENTLKVIETNSFNSEGELVRFKFKNGKVESIRYTGTTMWPEPVWQNMMKERKSYESLQG